MRSSKLSAINAESAALGYAPDGTNKSYDMATIVSNTDGTFQLKVASRGEADTTAIELNSAGSTADVTFFGKTEMADVDADALSVGTAVTDELASATQVVGGLNISTAASAVEALVTIGSAITIKDEARAKFGYKMNRLESTQSVLNIQAENLMTSESRISDVDVATEMATMTRNQVLSQAGVAMLSQANTMPQMALSLLR